MVARNNSIIGTLALGAVALLASCYGHASGYAEADAPVAFVDEPTLVVVEPGIWVVRDYDYAVYYVDDYYWVYRDDRWHRSRTYDRGWVTVDVTVVPRVIVTRDHHAYVHYRGGPNAVTRKAPRQPGDDRDRPGHDDDRRARDARPGHDDHPGVDPRDENKGKRNDDKRHEDERHEDERDDHGKKDDKKHDDRGKPDRDDQNRDDRKDKQDKG